MNFVAIDFETANSNPASACSLGIVVVKDGNIADQKQWLIKPLNGGFNKYNVATHGITATMVETAPTFAELWQDIQPYIYNRTIIAHNVVFDINVLKHVAFESGIDLPLYRSVCSVALARKAWPQLENHKLPTVATQLGLVIDHHNALSDAYACAQVAIAACQQLNIRNMDECQSIYATSSERQEVERDFWDEHGFEIHYDEEQIKRQSSSTKVNVCELNLSDHTGIINDYKVSLLSCGCRDFQMRQKPCKHMYRLASELKIFNIESCQKQASNRTLSRSFNKIDMNEVYKTVINNWTDEMLSGKLSRDDFEDNIINLMQAGVDGKI